METTDRMVGRRNLLRRNSIRKSINNLIGEVETQNFDMPKLEPTLVPQSLLIAKNEEEED